MPCNMTADRQNSGVPFHDDVGDDDDDDDDDNDDDDDDDDDDNDDVDAV